MAETILDRWFAPSSAQQRPTDYAGYYNMLTRTPVDSYTAACEAIRDADLRDQVGSLQIPALVLCGAQDVATPPETVQSLADALSQSRFVVIDNAGHLPCIEQPSPMASIIRQFFRGQILCLIQSLNRGHKFVVKCWAMPTSNAP